MKIFIIDELNKIEAVCDWQKTRSGFKHVATLMDHGIERESVKICYLNRTWEAYEYQSVLSKLLDKAGIKDADKVKAMARAEGNAEEETKSILGSIAMVAKMGDILATGQKEKNDWKLRMLKAGIQGIDVPADWDDLKEADKEKRLNAVINQLKNN